MGVSFVGATARSALTLMSMNSELTGGGGPQVSFGASSTRYQVLIRSVLGGDLETASDTYEVDEAPIGPGAVVEDVGCLATTIERSDDSPGSGGWITLSSGSMFADPVNWFGVEYTHFWVNNNGGIQFGRILVGDSPQGDFNAYSGIDLNSSNNNPIIVPIFFDLDTRAQGTSQVTFGPLSSPFNGSLGWCINWVNVGEFRESSPLASAQMLLLDKGSGDVDIVMNYNWLDAEIDYAIEVGFAAPGSSDNNYRLEGSGGNPPSPFLDGEARALTASRSIPDDYTAVSSAGRYVLPVRGGQAQSPQSPGTPSAPRSVQAARGSGSVTVQWLEPADDGGGVLDYRVDIRSEGGNWTSETVDAATRSLVISGLDDETVYEARVFARSAGLGAASETLRVAVGATSSPAPTPVVVVTPPTPAAPTPPPTVAAPPARPAAVIAGVPAEVQVRVPAPTPSTPGAPTAPEPTTLEVTAGPVRVSVQVPGAGRVRETTESVAVEVVRDRAGVLAGEGARPGSTVRAVVHTVAGESRPIAQITVNADGSYSGEMVFDGSVDGRPLPIGAHVLRLLAETPAGEELALDVVVEVAQPDPAPERFFASQEIPVAAPGQVLATNAGDPEVVSLEVLPVDGRTVAQADGWSMAVEVAADAGRVAADGGAARIEIVQDAGAAVAGDGFMPGTRADVWLFSTPVLLGSATIEADGSFSGFVPVDSGAVDVGEHTLQLQGVGADGYVRSLNVGVAVAGPEVPGRLPEAGGGSGELMARWALLLGAIGALVVLVGGGRRRRSSVSR